MLWQKTFIHSVDKDPFVSESWEFFSVCVRVCVLVFFLTSVLSHVPSVACGQTAVLPRFDVGAYNETVPQTAPRSPCCEAVYIRLLSRAGPEVIRLLYDS